jgi:23S rRNA (cytidine1920-2'-O)/16S rRNA (cytidine1409-2'-O)-methyltransferase
LKTRLDTVLVQRGFFSSRSQAAAAVLAGEVSVGGRQVTKAGTLVAGEAEIELRERQRFASRGGLKLEHAFEVFPIDVTGRVALDAGASTGGLTDCLLSHGARKVIAVDVGYGQLDWKLRQDPRVETLERTNIRYLKPEDMSEPASFATLDLSFISLKKVLPAVIELLGPDCELVALVKPQFEAGRGLVGKGGVVRDPAVRREVLAGMWEFAQSMGLSVLGLVESGVPGPKGNIEYLLYLAGAGRAIAGCSPDREEVLAGLFDRVESAE